MNKFSRLLVAGLLSAVLMTPLTPLTPVSLRTAGAATLSEQEARVKELKARMGSLQRAANSATARYEKAYQKAVAADAEFAESLDKLKVAKQRKKHYQGVLNNRVSSIYRGAGVSFLDVIFGTRSFDEFLVRWEMLLRIGNKDAKLVGEMKKVKAEIQYETGKLAVRKRERRLIADNLERKQQDVEQRLGDIQSLYDEEKSELKKIRKIVAKAAAKDVPSNFNVSGDWVFPVQGPHSYIDSWHAPRTGHLHQGTDVMADSGTPLVAVVSGTISLASNNGTAGNTIYLYGSDGNTYYYMHCSGFARGEGSVRKGELIGYVGDTGNASGGAPHLHFEIHPGGGSAINPYPILSAYDY